MSDMLQLVAKDWQHSVYDVTVVSLLESGESLRQAKGTSDQVGDRLQPILVS